jgi:hypothetical protein
LRFADARGRIESIKPSTTRMDVPDFASLFEWLGSAEQIANRRRHRKPDGAESLSEVLVEPNRFVVVMMPNPKDLIVEPPYLVDLAREEAIAFKKTRGMGVARLNALSWHGVKFLEARSRRSKQLLKRLSSGRTLTGDAII